MDLVLAASGLPEPTLAAAIREAQPQPSPELRVAIVTTASPWKERNRHAVAARAAFGEWAVRACDFLDLEFEPAERLADYDLVYLGGGNPLVLLHHLRRSGAAELLATPGRLPRLRVLVGISAGAVVLGPSVAQIDWLDPAANTVALADLRGLGLTSAAVVPHSNRLFARDPGLAERLRGFGAERGLDLVPLPDGSVLAGPPSKGPPAALRFWSPGPQTSG